MKTEPLSWSYHLPLFSSFIWKNISLGFLITFFVIAFLGILFGAITKTTFSSQTPDIYFAAGFVGLVIFLTLLVFIIIFHNGFTMKYRIDEHGVHQSVTGPSAKVHKAAIILGLLSRSPSAVGAGILAKEGEQRTISWGEVKKVNVNPSKQYLRIARQFLGIYPIDMFCQKSDFDRVLDLISQHVPKGKIQTRK